MSVVPVAALNGCLRELTDYVVLRNEEDLFGNLERGGDIDLLVRNPALAERVLVRHLGSPVRITRRSYVTEYGYDWGCIDVLPAIEWRGACFVDADAVLGDRRVSDRRRPVPRPAHEASISWLTSLLWGGFFNERYAPFIRLAAEVDGVAFQQVLMGAAGRKWGSQLWHASNHPEPSATWTQPLRRAVWWRSCVTSPVRTTGRYLAFVIAELKLRYDPPVPWIAILSHEGKRTAAVVDEVVRRFDACPYARVRAVTVPHEKAASSTPASTLARLAVAGGWLIGYWARLVHFRAKGYILACDSVSPGLVVDHARRRGTSEPRLARAFGSLLPKPDLVFLLASDTDALRRQPQDALLERPRQSHGNSAFVRQRAAVHALDGRSSPSTQADEIQRVIRAWMSDRSVASLRGIQAQRVPAPTAAAEGSSNAPTL